MSEYVTFRELLATVIARHHAEKIGATVHSVKENPDDPHKVDVVIIKHQPVNEITVEFVI